MLTTYYKNKNVKIFYKYVAKLVRYAYIYTIKQTNKQKQTAMNYSVTQLQEKLTSEYRMDAKVYELGQDVIFFGSELECYKMADKFKTKESRVAYSENLGAFYVSFPEWFNAKFAKKIASK